MNGSLQTTTKTGSFLLRSDERGHNRFKSTGEASSYIAGHPEAVLTRKSSFSFGPYQDGRHGFGMIRVFGDETFSGLGCGYNIHRHHNFIICAFVLSGQLTHINTLGWTDELHAGDYYVFSAGSGGKHCELNIRAEDLHVIYIWFLPDQLLLPPSYQRGHFDAGRSKNRIVQIVGDAGALPINQDVRVSRLYSDRPGRFDYKPGTVNHGVYAFVISGRLRRGDTTLGPGDSLGTWGDKNLAFETDSDETEILFVETRM